MIKYPLYISYCSFKNLDNMNRLNGFSSDSEDLEKQQAINGELRQALLLRDEVISITSHEMKIPITSLKIQTQLLHSKLKSGQNLTSDDLLSLLNNFDKELKRLQFFADSIADSAYPEKIQKSVTPTTFNLHDFLHSLISNLEPFIPTPNIKLKLQLEVDSSLYVTWDPLRMEQVLTNIIFNAFKFAPLSNVLVRVTKPNDNITITIKDSGPGIPLEVQSLIFERFYKGHHSASSPGGVGLGLYIAKEIILAHQGDIKVESRKNEGAKFIISLPLDLY